MILHVWFPLPGFPCKPSLLVFLPHCSVQAFVALLHAGGRSALLFAPLCCHTSMAACTPGSSQCPDEACSASPT